MKAILVEHDELVWADAPEPELGPGQVRIDNHATAVNRADLAQRRGGYPPPPGASPILGLECAGVVSAIGEGVSRVAPGDEVCALLAGGGYAETVVGAGRAGLAHSARVVVRRGRVAAGGIRHRLLEPLYGSQSQERRARCAARWRERRRHRRHPDVQGIRQPGFRHVWQRRQDRPLRSAGRGRWLQPPRREFRASARRVDGGAGVRM